MPRRSWIGLLLVNCLVQAQGADMDGWNEASGVNLTADEGFGARHSGMGITFAGFHRDADATANAPAAMNDVDDFTFSTAHAERFGEAKFDDIALLVPFDARSTLGLGLSRYGVSDIDWNPEGVDRVGDRAPGQFSIADYLAVVAFARRWGGLDLGGNVHLLYRQLDQDGFGLRADAMAAYTWHDRIRVSALLKGVGASAAAWESGYSEYEPTDLLLGAAIRIPAPYFYGTLQAAYQTEGLFQRSAKSASEGFSDRLHSDPLGTLRAGNLGLEFLFDFGLTARFGVTEMLSASDLPSNLAFGMGYSWRRVLALDYSFAPHPDLLATHRIALQFTPAFPKFNGRGFRPGSGAPRPTPASAPLLPPVEEEEEEGLLEEPEAPAPAMPPRAAPATSPAPATPATAPAAAPAPIAPAAAPAQTAPSAVPAAPAPIPARPAPEAPAAPAPEAAKPRPQAPAPESLEEEIEDEE